MSIYTEGEIEAIRSRLARLAESASFAKSNRLFQFLSYCVEEVLQGRGNKLNQFAIGVEVYGRGEEFDPTTDSVVRVDAGRLRAKLREYYEGEGSNDTIRFALPKGRYRVDIQLKKPDDPSRAFSQSELRFIHQQRRQRDENIAAKAHKFTLAVMPFSTTSAVGEDMQLAEAAAAAIVNQLSRSKSIDVVSMGATGQYRERKPDPRDIGAELNVNYLIDGILRRSGKRIRLAISLVDTVNGRVEWSEDYERTIVDSFEFEDDIGATVVSVLGSVLARTAMATAQRQPVDKLDSASVVHRALEIFFNFSRQSFLEGEMLGRRAIEEVPDSGHGHMLLAFIQLWRAFCYWCPDPRQALQESREAAERAVELSADDSWILSVSRETFQWSGDFRRAVTLAERACALEPDSIVHRARLGNALVHLGQVEEGLALINESMDSGQAGHSAPPWHYWFLAHAYNQLGSWADAASAARTFTELEGGCPAGWMIAANAMANQGKLEDANYARDQLLAMSPAITLQHLEYFFTTGSATKPAANNQLSGLRRLDWNAGI